MHTANKINFERGAGKVEPLYMQLERKIKSDIHSGHISKGSCLPSVSQLVRKFGLDYKTVNLALDRLEEGGVVKRSGQKGVGAIVANFAQEAALSISYVRWDHSVLSMGISEGIKSYAAQKHLNFSIIEAMSVHGNMIDAISYISREVDGAVIVPHEIPEYAAVVKSALEAGCNLVFADRYLENFSVSCVSADHTGGAYQAVKHLISKHNMPVYCIGVTDDPSSVRDRIKGWASAMLEHNYMELEKYQCRLKGNAALLTADPILSHEYFSNCARKLFSQHKKNKYCVFAINDEIARSVCHVAGEFGLEVGEDLFIIGFGDMAFCEKLPVNLSSVYQSDKMVGFAAAEILHNQILNNNADNYLIRKVLPVELRLRESSEGQR